jgi:hypothetical protein
MKTTNFFIAVTLLLSSVSFAQVGIGTTNPKAALDIVSTSQGLLPPRMTEAQMNAINGDNLSNGLIVFCTDCNATGCLNSYINGAWLCFTANPATEVIVTDPGYITGSFIIGQPVVDGQAVFTITNNSFNVVGPINFTNVTSLSGGGSPGLSISPNTDYSAVSINPGEQVDLIYDITGTSTGNGVLVVDFNAVGGLIASANNSLGLVTDDPSIIYTRMIGDFETENYVIRPSATEDYQKYFWGHYINARGYENHANLSYNTSDKVEGARSLQVSMIPGMSTDGLPSAPSLAINTHNGVRKHFIREIVTDFLSEEWLTNTYNKMVFYIKTPAVTKHAVIGKYNFEVGTHYSSVAAGGPTSSNGEVGGDHGYHRFDVAPGVWTKCILDFHPSHLRGQNGGIDHGNMEYPIAADTPAYNYFDLLTRLYFYYSRVESVVDGETWLFDKFQFYRDSNDEEEDLVYSINASHNTANNELTLGWNTKKELDDTSFEIRYAFEDIHSIGFETAILLDEVGRDRSSGYNLTLYKNSDVDLTGQAAIYLAVKPTNSTKFKQIKLELGL